MKTETVEANRITVGDVILTTNGMRPVLAAVGSGATGKMYVTVQDPVTVTGMVTLTLNSGAKVCREVRA